MKVKFIDRLNELTHSFMNKLMNEQKRQRGIIKSQQKMKQSSTQQIQKITPLLKIVRSRQQLYLQLLNFITKNIQSSSNHHQQLNLFTKFLTSIKLQQKQILPEEKDILAYFDHQDDSLCTVRESVFVSHVTKNNKQILRLCSRLIEILDAAISKTRNSIFSDNGRLSLQFSRWKKNLHNIVKGETVHLGEFINHVLNYVRSKYKKQLAKVQKYIFKLESGANVALKDLYLKQKSDDSEPQQIRYPKEEKDQQKAEHCSETDLPNKRSSKKPLLKSTKKGHKLFKSTKKQRQLSVHSDTKPPKQYTANRMLKHMNMMQLSKKQFLQDYIYQKNEQEQHRKKLLSSLMQRNKTISVQISTYYKRSLVYEQKIRQRGSVMSSGEQKEADKSSKEKKSSDEMSHSMLKNNSLRKSFVISKRKSSLNFQKGSKILTQHDESVKNDFIKTMKNFTTKRKTSAQTTQRSINKSKKLFVIKSPVVFEDDNIPQAPVMNNGQGGWFRAPMTSRKPQKKTQNLRLKRRNNPLPIQNSLFNQSFKFTDNKF